MSDVAIAEPPQSKPDRSKRIDQLTPRVRRAIDLMIWDAMPYDEAAREVGLTTRAMRLALGKPHVVAALKREMHVLKTSEGPASIKRIKTIRDAAENKPALDAAMWFVTEDEQQSRQSGVSASPGVTIRVVTVVQSAPVQTYPSDMSRPDVKQINGLADSTSNGASTADLAQLPRPSDSVQAIPQSAPRGGRGQK